MGANSPRSPIPQPETKPGPFLSFVVAGMVVLIVCALQWSDVVEYFDGEARLNAKHQQQLQKKLNELDEAEQYALIATKEGY